MKDLCCYCLQIMGTMMLCIQAEHQGFLALRHDLPEVSSDALLLMDWGKHRCHDKSIPVR